jgi:hypothetical protein
VCSKRNETNAKCVQYCELTNCLRGWIEERIVDQLSKPQKIYNSFNYFGDWLEERDLPNIQIPQIITEEGGKIMNAIVTSYARDDRTFSLMNNTANVIRKQLLTENFSPHRGETSRKHTDVQACKAISQIID